MVNSSARTVFVLRSEDAGNRSAHIVEAGEEYTMDLDTIVEYSDATANFPYSV